MRKIAIISPSVRKGRNSHRAALFFLNLITEKNLAEAEILDLLEYDFPLFNERLKYQDSPLKRAKDFAERIKSADGVIVLSVEYNGAPPASLKNAVDLLTDEWRRKPLAFVSLSDGHFGGTQAIIALQFAFLKLGAVSVPSVLRIPFIKDAFDVNGVPGNRETWDKRGVALVNELLWYVENLAGKK